MTEKAQAVLKKIRQRQALRRDRILDELNRSTLDDVGPVGAQDQQMRVLSEMNELGQAQEQIIRDSFPKVTVY